MVYYEIMCFFCITDMIRFQRISKRFYSVLIPFSMQDESMMVDLSKVSLSSFPNRWGLVLLKPSHQPVLPMPMSPPPRSLKMPLSPPKIGPASDKIIGKKRIFNKI